VSPPKIFGIYRCNLVHFGGKNTHFKQNHSNVRCWRTAAVQLITYFIK